MFRSLRNLLIISHILPSILIIPLLGIAIIYVVENKILLPVIYDNLAADATLFAEITSNQPEILSNPSIAQVLVNGASKYLSGQISILDLDGNVLVSSDETSTGLREQFVELPNIKSLQKGEVIQLQHGPLAEVFVVVFGPSGQPLGVIRMTSRVLTVTEEIFQLRYWLGSLMITGIFGGVLLGLFLAFRINKPIQKTTTVILSLATGELDTQLSEDGPYEIKVLAQAVNSLSSRLHSLEKSRKQLLANLVHELGRPLGALKSAVLALLKGANKDPELEQGLLTGMEYEISRLQRLLDNLAELYDQIMGPLELKKESFDLKSWLDVAISPWAVVASEKNLSWEVNFPDDVPTLNADSDRLTQALGNLINNAIKFTPKGGKVTISGGVQDHEIWLRVSDTGPGIPESEQDKIFNPFYRQGDGQRIVQGMGLGLTIARDIIKAHGGRLEVISELGTGSLFTIWLPIIEKRREPFETNASIPGSPKRQE